jgi:hypothetical protein
VLISGGVVARLGAGNATVAPSCYHGSYVEARAPARHLAQELSVDSCPSSLDQYHNLRRCLVEQVNLLVGRGDHDARLLLFDILGYLHAYCATCAAELAAPHDSRCPQCGADQPWVGN